MWVTAAQTPDCSSLICWARSAAVFFFMTRLVLADAAAAEVIELQLCSLSHCVCVLCLSLLNVVEVPRFLPPTVCLSQVKTWHRSASSVDMHPSLIQSSISCPYRRQSVNTSAGEPWLTSTGSSQLHTVILGKAFFILWIYFCSGEDLNKGTISVEQIVTPKLDLSASLWVQHHCQSGTLVHT